MKSEHPLNTLQHSFNVNYSYGEENYLRLCCLILYCLMFFYSVAYHMENKPIIIIIIIFFLTLKLIGHRQTD